MFTYVYNLYILLTCIRDNRQIRSGCPLCWGVLNKLREEQLDSMTEKRKRDEERLAAVLPWEY